MYAYRHPKSNILNDISSGKISPQRNPLVNLSTKIPTKTSRLLTFLAKVEKYFRPVLRSSKYTK